MALRHPAALCCPGARIPKSKVSSAQGLAKEFKRISVRFLTIPAPTKVETKPKIRQERINLQTKNCKQKGKGKQRENGPK